MKKSFWVAAVFLVCVIGVFVKGTVVSQAKSKIKQENETYHELEREYIKETRQTLKKAGFANSGVNLTKVIDGEGNRVYTMVVHNSKINNLDETGKSALLEQLKGIEFGDDNCQFYHEFLVP